MVSPLLLGSRANETSGQALLRGGQSWVLALCAGDGEKSREAPEAHRSSAQEAISLERDLSVAKTDPHRVAMFGQEPRNFDGMGQSQNGSRVHEGDPLDSQSLC